MSVAWYIVLERHIPGMDASVNGNSLAHAAELLDSLAEQASVPPLMNFFSAHPDDLAGFAEDLDVEIESSSLPAESWFSAAEGLRTVRALAQVVEASKIEGSDEILADLKEFDKVLRLATDNGVRWHLAVDF